jgi:hypothetical protein
MMCSGGSLGLSRRAIVPVLFSFMLGCSGDKGPELGTVSGTVRFAGAPLPKASVNFIPENGRPSFGLTDDSGVYELKYTNDKPGAAVGKHTVRISTYRPPDENEGIPAVPESIPAIYNQSTELTADVKSGKNTIDFDLLNNSPVVQPGTEAPRRSQPRDTCGGDDDSESESFADADVE